MATTTTPIRGDSRDTEPSDKEVIVDGGMAISESPPPPKTPGPSPPPNGGRQAWTNVLGSFMLYFNTWGILNAFGAYQTYYESGKLFTTTSSNISWIGAIAAFMLMFVGIFVGPIYDRGYLRTLLCFGTFMVVFGHMMISICKTYWQVLLAQGFVVGIGTGCLFVPCVAIIPQYFSTKMGTALGVAVSGSALGGVAYPIVLYRLIEEIGFPWAVRTIGFIALATLVVPMATMKLRVQPPKIRAVVDTSSFTDIPYMAFTLTALVTYMGLFVIIFYLSYFAEAQRITDTALAFYLVPLFNFASIFGRLLPNVAADKVGPFNLLIPSAVASGLLMLCMIAVNSKGAVIVMALLSGFFSGALIGLPPICLSMLTPDKSRLGTRIGMAYAMIAVGVLAGGPGAGALLDNGEKTLHWTKLWVFCGVLTAASALGFLGVRIGKYGPKIGTKA